MFEHPFILDIVGPPPLAVETVLSWLAGSVFLMKLFSIQSEIDHKISDSRNWSQLRSVETQRPTLTSVPSVNRIVKGLFLHDYKYITYIIMT